MRMLPLAAVLLGALAGAPADALAQAGDGGIDRDRLGAVERQVGEAEDVIVEQVLALRRRVEALEARVRVLEATLAAAAPATTPTSPERLQQPRQRRIPRRGAHRPRSAQTYG